MWLTTEEAGDLPDVTAADIDHALADDNFGKFAVLSASEDDFIQAGNDWQPGEECRAFMTAHDSDPWVLEYRDGATGRLYRAGGRATLEQVLMAFRSYLAGGRAWRGAFAWGEAVG